MRPVRIITPFLFAAAVAVAGCTAHSTVVDPSAAAAPAVTAPRAIPIATIPIHPASVTTSRSGQDPKSTPTPTTPGRLYFATPQAAMRYLTAAYNRNDLVALGHVTTPIARVNLVAMRRTAVNLRLVGCTANAGRGDYLCSFAHDYPASLHLAGNGHAHFTAAPADKFGWYMTVLNDCG
jgi:hypothetical protein